MRNARARRKFDDRAMEKLQQEKMTKIALTLSMSETLIHFDCVISSVGEIALAHSLTRAVAHLECAISILLQRTLTHNHRLLSFFGNPTQIRSNLPLRERYN